MPRQVTAGKNCKKPYLHWYVFDGPNYHFPIQIEKCLFVSAFSGQILVSERVFKGEFTPFPGGKKISMQSYPEWS